MCVGCLVSFTTRDVENFRLKSAVGLVFIGFDGVR